MSTDHHGLGRTQCQQPAPSGSGPDGSHRIVERKVEVPTPREFSPPHAGFRGRVRQPGAYLPIELTTGGQRLWLWRGSNPRPAHYECAALPSELHSMTSSVRSWLWRRPDSNRRLRGYEPRGLTELPYSAIGGAAFSAAYLPWHQSLWTVPESNRCLRPARTARYQLRQQPMATPRRA